MKKSNINCSSGNCTEKSKLSVYPGDRIETGDKSSVSVMLNDGTAVIIYERSDVTLFSIFNMKEKTLTSIYSDYGKFKIIQKNSLVDASLVVKTRNAIIKSVCATINVIAAESESGLFVYKGEAGFASIDPSVPDAYVVKSGYESFLKKNSPPALPKNVNIDIRSSWQNRYFITKDRDSIVRYDGLKGPVDWFFTDKK